MYIFLFLLAFQLDFSRRDSFTNTEPKAGSASISSRWWNWICSSWLDVDVKYMVIQCYIVMCVGHRFPLLKREINTYLFMLANCVCRRLFVGSRCNLCLGTLHFRFAFPPYFQLFTVTPIFIRNNNLLQKLTYTQSSGNCERHVTIKYSYAVWRR